MARTLSEDIEEFRRMINGLVEQLEEVSNSSRTVPQTEAALLSRKFAELMEGLEENRKQLKSTTELLDDISNRWG
jgi:Sec-independent protein translocase protein TatA